MTWLKNENGLRFGRYGTVRSSGAFGGSNPDAGTAVSVEIWLGFQRIDDSNTVLSFYEPRSPSRFSLRQSRADIAFESVVQAHPEAKPVSIYLDNAVRNKTPLFLTFTTSAHGARVYVDGQLARSFPGFVPLPRAFTGHLVAGDSPVESDSWSGQLRGLAIYGRKLTAAQVLGHYRTWTQAGRPQRAEDERAIAVYLFDERAGSVVHNSADAVDLLIPAKYGILDQRFLEPFWKEFRNDWGYWKNVLINVGGFIPLGYFFYAYLSLGWRIRRPGSTAILIGAAVSLLIEVGQAFLPTRQSGTTDLLTNTLGTSLGVALDRLGIDPGSLGRRMKPR